MGAPRCRSASWRHKDSSPDAPAVHMCPWESRNQPAVTARRGAHASGRGSGGVAACAGSAQTGLPPGSWGACPRRPARDVTSRPPGPTRRDAGSHPGPKPHGIPELAGGTAETMSTREIHLTAYRLPATGYRDAWPRTPLTSLSTQQAVSLRDGVPPSGVTDQADGITRSRREWPSWEALLRLAGPGSAVIARAPSSGPHRTAPKRRRRTVIGYTTTGDTTAYETPA